MYEPSEMLKIVLFRNYFTMQGNLTICDICSLNIYRTNMKPRLYATLVIALVGCTCNTKANVSCPCKNMFCFDDEDDDNDDDDTRTGFWSHDDLLCLFTQDRHWHDPEHISFHSLCHHLCAPLSIVYCTYQIIYLHNEMSTNFVLWY